jgi:hypothetical protein
MNVNSYTFIDPEGTEAGAQFKKLGSARPFAADRLVQALEDFARTDTDLSCKIAGSRIEIYLVPPRTVLAHVPDAAALVRVNHERQEIDVVRIVAPYGGYDEAKQWDNVTRIAHKFAV